jgi:phosphoribosylformylglycinamidine synthase
VPRLNVEETLPLYRSVASAVAEGLVQSATTPSMGGLALALARTALAGRLGLELDVTDVEDLGALDPDVALFSESPGRFLITVAETDVDRFAAHFAGLPCRRVGRVTSEARLSVRAGARVWLDVGVDALATAFKETLADE